MATDDGSIIIGIRPSNAGESSSFEGPPSSFNNTLDNLSADSALRGAGGTSDDVGQKKNTVVFPPGIDNPKSDDELQSYMIFGVRKILVAASNNISSAVGAVLGTVAGDQFLLRSYDKTFLSVILPIPPALQINQAVGWENAELGAVGGGVVNASRKESSVVDALKSGAVDAFVRSAIQTGSFLSGIEGINAKRAITKNIVNPRLEVLFQGINFRTFAFSFKLSPNSMEEADTVKNIVRIFRYHSAPSIPKGTEGRYIEFPSLFEITFKHKFFEKHPAIPNINSAVCTGVDVDFTSAGSWAELDNGSPVETLLTLTFTETLIPTKERIAVEDPDFRYK